MPPFFVVRLNSHSSPSLLRFIRMISSNEALYNWILCCLFFSLATDRSWFNCWWILVDCTSISITQSQIYQMTRTTTTMHAPLQSAQNAHQLIQFKCKSHGSQQMDFFLASSRMFSDYKLISQILNANMQLVDSIYTSTRLRRFDSNS